MGHLRKNFPVQLSELKSKRAKRTGRAAKPRTTEQHSEVDIDETTDYMEGVDAPLEVIVLNHVITLFRFHLQLFISFKQ